MARGKRSACILDSYGLEPLRQAPHLVQSLTIRLRPHHKQWLDQQAIAASRSTVIRLLIEEAISAAAPQPAPINGR